MTALWLGIALLTALAIAIVFWPFLKAGQKQQDQADRRLQNITIFRERQEELEQERHNGALDDEAFEALKLELERNLLIDAEDEPEEEQFNARTRSNLLTVTLFAMLVPTMALGIYAEYGRSDDLQLALNKPADPFNGRTPSLEEAVAKLEEELQQRPENAEGWYMLSSTYLSMGRYDDSVQGFAKVLELLPKTSPQYSGVMGQYAQAMFFANGGKMNDAVRKQISATLAFEPMEVTALGLQGIDAFEQARYEAAIQSWRLALQNAGGAAEGSLRSGIERAVAALKAEGKTVPDMPELAEARIKVHVSLSEELQTRASEDQVVFVFARPVGGRMPLAAARISVADLPLELTLDDSQAMTPQARLSSVDEVEVTAKVSVSGQPESSSGDLVGKLSPVSVRGDDKTLSLVIDQVVE
ncbi:c-type cytochrome biogenesis protein CcmI [Marinobacterium jannaschii]|uniref:c-type cytochrome biogenesis protein CcmI n=1 Tax=Marinobacterium jannaschii TaxID=64970 RepID=UPI000485C006|nr:c-type cytochrome biogenesis protein CcmI [Marinobacterium jannaschii]